MKTWNDESGAGGDDDDSKPVGSVLNAAARKEKPKVQTFTGTGVSLGGDPKPAQQSDLDAALVAQYGADPELIEALKISMQEEESKQMIIAPEPAKDVDPEKIVTIQLRCPDGSRLMRRFMKETTTVSDLITYFKIEKKKGLQDQVVVMTTFPKKVLEDESKTLTELGFGK